jgi:hypothetical protein
MAVPESVGSTWEDVRTTYLAVDAALAAGTAFRAAAASNRNNLAELAREAHLAFGEAWERLYRAKM